MAFSSLRNVFGRLIEGCGLLVMAIVAGGCTASPLEYRPDSPARTMTVNDEAQYNLYVNGDAIPTHLEVVAEGDPVGFTKVGDDVLAVAGRKTYPIREAAYCWRRITPPRDPLNDSIAEFYHVPLVGATLYAAGAILSVVTQSPWGPSWH